MQSFQVDSNLAVSQKVFRASHWSMNDLVKKCATAFVGPHEKTNHLAKNGAIIHNYPLLQVAEESLHLPQTPDLHCQKHHESCEARGADLVLARLPLDWRVAINHHARGKDFDGFRHIPDIYPHL